MKTNTKKQAKMIDKIGMHGKRGANPREILNDIRNNFVNTNKSNKINVIDDETKLSYTIIKLWNNNYPNKILNNLRLQKTLYFVYGMYYGMENKELISSINFSKWRLGPVLSKIYYQIKSIKSLDGFSNIDTKMYLNYLNENFLVDNLDYEIKEKFEMIKINNILKLLSKYDTFDLVEKSHRTEPWINTKNSENIDKTELLKYFSNFDEDKFEKL
jgi:uncharacterized phage-associated protein